MPDHQLQRVRRSLLYRETKTEASDAWFPIPDIVTAALKTRRGQQDEEREAAGEIWQQTKDVPSLILTGRYGTATDPRTLNRKFVARCEAAGVRPMGVDARRAYVSVPSGAPAGAVIVRQFVRQPAGLAQATDRL